MLMLFEQVPVVFSGNSDTLVVTYSMRRNIYLSYKIRAICVTGCYYWLFYKLCKVH